MVFKQMQAGLMVTTTRATTLSHTNMANIVMLPTREDSQARHGMCREILFLLDLA